MHLQRTASENLFVQPTLMANANSRLSAMDIQRGIIMTLMSYCHCQEYVAAQEYHNLKMNVSPAWAGTSPLDILHQIFISSLVAGGFFMMMGIGIVFLFHSRIKEGWSAKRTCRYLILRGLLLIAIQFSILQLFEFIAEREFYLYIGVLFSLGMCMIFSGLCLLTITYAKSQPFFAKIKIQFTLPLFLIILIIGITQATISYLQANGITPGPLLILLLLPDEFTLHSHFLVDVNFTPIPWFPAVAMGLVIGQLLLENRHHAFNKIGKISLSFIIAWFVLRTANLHGWTSLGDFKLIEPNQTYSWVSYFCVSKYPPSLAYFLWALGINLGLIYCFFNAEKRSFRIIKIIEPIKTFGRCALFFFIMHWLIYYSLSTMLSERLTSSLAMVAFWLLGLLILFPLCKLYYRFKMSTPKESIWRMF